MEKQVSLGTALVTPFKKKKVLSLRVKGSYHVDTEVDYNALKLLVKKQVNNGVDFLIPCGTTGESPTLSNEEQIEVIKFVVSEAGNVPVLAGTGSNDTAKAVCMTAAAKSVGAKGVLAVAPYYNKPTTRGLLHYFREIAEVGLPVVLYDIPGRCGGKGVSAETIIALANEGVISGLKWASGDLNQLMEVINNCPSNFSVLSGDDNLTYSLMALGGHGAISVVSNIIPKEMAEFMNQMMEGDWRSSRMLHYYLLELMRAMFIETNPIPVKTALSLMYPHSFWGIFRSPMSVMEKKNFEKLEDVLGRYDLLPRLKI